MPSSTFVDPSRVIVDHVIGNAYVSFRGELEQWLAKVGAMEPGDILRQAASKGYLAGRDGNLVKLALAAETVAGQASLQCLASDRYSLLARELASEEIKACIFAAEPPVQALCIADRTLQVETAGETVVLTGVIKLVPGAVDADWLYIVVFEEGERSCYLTPSDRSGISLDRAMPAGAADVILNRVAMAANDRLAADTQQLEGVLATINVLDGLEALAAAQRVCDESVAAAKRNPLGSATGFDDQDTQFRLAAVQARLMIASGYRASVYRELASGNITPFKGAVAKLWLSQCVDEAMREATLAGLGPRDRNAQVMSLMLPDAMRGNLLREVIAGQL